MNGPDYAIQKFLDWLQQTLAPIPEALLWVSIILVVWVVVMFAALFFTPGPARPDKFRCDGCGAEFPTEGDLVAHLMDQGDDPT